MDQLAFLQGLGPKCNKDSNSINIQWHKHILLKILEIVQEHMNWISPSSHKKDFSKSGHQGQVATGSWQSQHLKGLSLPRLQSLTLMYSIDNQILGVPSLNKAPITCLCIWLAGPGYSYVQETMALTKECHCNITLLGVHSFVHVFSCWSERLLGVGGKQEPREHHQRASWCSVQPSLVTEWGFSTRHSAEMDSGLRIPL